MRYFLIVIAILVILYLPCSLVSSATPQKHSPVPVVVEEVVEAQLQETFTFVGTVKPEQRSLVATEIDGLVEELLYKEGDYVEKGSAMARLKQESLQIQLQEARAALNEANARLDYARSKAKRFEDLYQRKVIPVEELQEVEAERDAWSEKAIQLQSKIEGLEYDINQTEIKAPFSGYIISKHTEIGEWLVRGKAVYELIDMESLYILAYVPEHIAVRFKQDDPVQIMFDAFPDIHIQGKILSIIPQASEDARTFPVKVGFKNEGSLIKSGLMARVSFLVSNGGPSKLVHKDAIVEMHNQKFIYIVDNGIANPIQVETGLAHEDLIEVFGPVAVGTPVVVRGNERLSPGQSVEMIEME